jgi:hypothetical protein
VRLTRCEVGKVPRCNELHVLKRLGCGLRLAMENVANEELPHELGHLLSRLAQLQPTARLRPRPIPDRA